MSEKYTTDEWTSRAVQVHGDRYDYSLVRYEGAGKPVSILCPAHGEFAQKASGHLLGYGCKKCGDTRKGSTAKLTLAEVQSKIAEAHPGNKYSFPRIEQEYGKVTDRLTIVCPDHGEFKQKFYKFYGGQGCRKCGLARAFAKTRKTLFGFISEAQGVHGDRYDYSKVEYRGALKKVTLVCRAHNLEFQQTPSSHVNQMAGCPKCSVESRSRAIRVGFDEFMTRARERHGLTYEYPETSYLAASGKVGVVCPDHGEFLQRGLDHLDGHACPKCASTYKGIAWSVGSLGQMSLKSFLLDTLPGVEIEDNHVFSTGRRLEIDLYLPEFRLGIEYHGAYFHSSAFKSSGYHLEKLHLAQQANIRLLQVFSDEWANNRAAVETVLRAALGVNKPGRGARSYTVGMVPYTTARKFYESHHLLGGPAKKCCHYGLLDGDTLVAAMSFSHSLSARGRQTDPSVSELVRFCNPGSIPGAASRLFKAYTRGSPHVHKVVSFSDNRWYTGGLYEKLGFTKEAVLAPDYTYTTSKGIVRYPKARMQRTYLRWRMGDQFDESLSERQNALNAGFFQVYDCGKTRWIWSRLPP